MKYDHSLFDYEPVKRPGRKVPREADEFARPISNEDRSRVRHNSSDPRASLPPPSEPQTELTEPGKNLERWVVKRGHALSFLGLFLFTSILYFRPYELSASLQFLSGSAFWIALFTLAVFFPSQLILEGNLTARPREVNLVLLLCVTALLSIPLALNPSEAWETFNDTFIKAVLMFIVMVNVVRTRQRLTHLFVLAIAVSCVLSLKALDDYARGNLTVEGYRIAGSIGGMFGNPNDMALHLATILPIAVALIFTTRGPHKKIIYLFCSVLMLGGIFVTFSRGGFLALVAGLSVLGWKVGRRNRMAVAAGIAVILISFVLLAPGSYADRLGSILDPSRDAFGSSSARREVLKRSVLVTVKNPVLGVGMGNFHIVSIRELVSHNAYTQVSAEMGVTAMIIYIWFIISPFRKLRTIELREMEDRRRSRFYYLAIGLQASLFAYLVGSFFASVAYHWYVYYLVGYAICFRRIYRAEETSIAASVGDGKIGSAEHEPMREASIQSAPDGGARA